MEINRKLIKSLRAKRGWTQQQLADICTVNLRTIQRIESTGSASAESISSLSSAFEIHREELMLVPRVSPDELKPTQNKLYLFMGAALLFGFALGFLASTFTS